MRILYVEDEMLDAQLVARYINQTPHQVVIASTIEAAHTAMRDHPDLILADVVLGQTRAGYQLARDLRRQGYTQPIIAVTGLALAQDHQACYDAGFTDVLNKPYSIQELAAMLHKYID